MQRRSSSSSKAAVAALLALGVWGSPSRARAQACCAGGSAITPGRLQLHEDALVGAELKAGTVLGTYDPSGRFLRSPAGVTEGDFEEDLFGALRVLGRGQVALLVPFVETQRQDPTDGGRLGGGIGDVNLSARYDFVLAGESHAVPGVALLAGITFPTGRPPELASPPLAVDATGTGAFQGNVALALEQTYGPWLLNATGLLAVRSARFGEQLAPQGTLLAATAYTLPNDMALALSASYAFEGDATYSDGSQAAASSKRLAVVTLSGFWPLTDTWRVLAGIYVDPPIDGLGSNQPASGGLTFTAIRSWI
ncbi:MAG TPA: hypothetical protein VGL81_29920 [Polyangiaceae bacterium]|jgi:hypothetical protein